MVGSIVDLSEYLRHWLELVIQSLLVSGTLGSLTVARLNVAEKRLDLISSRWLGAELVPIEWWH